MLVTPDGTTLRTGDVIGSGTIGTGCLLELRAVHGPEEYRWLQPGDRVRMAVEQLGSFEVAIRGGKDPVPFGLVQMLSTRVADRSAHECRCGVRRR
jgi:hypothetical protein